MGNDDRRAFVCAQLELRCVVLDTWIREGVPEGQTVPASLNQARTWDAPTLGIQPIGSSRTFTTTHRVHGPHVRNIQKLLHELAVKHRVPRRGLKKLARERRAERESTQRTLVAAASQFATMSVELEEARLHLRITQQNLGAVRDGEDRLRDQNAQLCRENAKLLGENAQLRRELLRLSSLPVVTPLAPRRPLPTQES